MKVKINNKDHDFEKPLPLSNLLEFLQLGGKPVVVELNKNAIFPRNYEATMIQDGDSLEIVTIAAGG